MIFRLPNNVTYTKNNATKYRAPVTVYTHLQLLLKKKKNRKENKRRSNRKFCPRDIYA